MQHSKNSSRSRRLRWAIPAAALGALALVNRARALKAARDHPPIGQFIEVGGTRLHYVDKGEGKPILLVHGNGTMLQDWIISGVADELARTNRVLIIDRPGFGHSPRPRGTRFTAQRQADLFADFLKQVGAEGALVVGHSFGSLVVAAMATRHADLLSGVVLLGGYYFPVPRADILLVAPSAVPVLGDVIRHTMMPLVGHALQRPFETALFGPAEATPRWRSEFAWSMALRPSRARAGAADAVHMIPSAAAIAPGYGDIKMPVTIMAGGGDRLVDPTAQAVRLHETVKDSRLDVIEGVGHMIHHSAPTRVLEAIRAAA
jgi:pimeloyl-ACP methyl ester carboxylesterase